MTELTKGENRGGEERLGHFWPYGALVSSRVSSRGCMYIIEPLPSTIVDLRKLQELVAVVSTVLEGQIPEDDRDLLQDDLKKFKVHHPISRLVEPLTACRPKTN